MSLTKNILFINHHNEPELGIMEEFFINNNYDIKIAKPFHDSKLPTNLNNYSGIVVMGGIMNVEDDEKYPWIKDELNWLKDSMNTNIPIIGICLGAQLIAKTFGGEVGNHNKNFVEIGYCDIVQLKKNPELILPFHVHYM